MKQRLESLDALRGMDLLFLVAISDIIEELAEVVDTPWMNAIMECFTHKKWEGFSPWDLVMPLFMFMAGVAIPFALAKYKEASPRAIAESERLGSLCDGGQRLR